MVEVVRPEDGQRIEVGGPEEGGIVSAETQADGRTEAPKRHPLKHAWTFWFDNPNASSVQAQIFTASRQELNPSERTLSALMVESGLPPHLMLM